MALYLKIVLVFSCFVADEEIMTNPSVLFNLPELLGTLDVILKSQKFHTACFYAFFGLGLFILFHKFFIEFSAFLPQCSFECSSETKGYPL